MVKRKVETAEELRERLQRESDFAGEFEEVRKTNMTVDADKLISGSKPKNVLKNIKLFKSHKVDDEPVLISSDDMKMELEKKKMKGEDRDIKRQKVESSKAKEPVKSTMYHLDLDDDDDDVEQSIIEKDTDVPSTSANNKFIKLTKIQDDDLNSEDEDSQPRLININALKSFGKSIQEGDDAETYHLNLNDGEENTVKETHLNNEVPEESESKANDTNKNNDDNEDDDEDDNDEFFDAEDKEEESRKVKVEKEEATADDSISEIQVVNLKVKLYSKLTGKSNRIPYGLESKFQDMYGLLESTVKERESQSALVVGAKNSGKTACLNAALEHLRSDIASTTDDFLLIKISGITQEDDKSAVKSIARQLDSEIARAYHINIRELDDAELLAQKSVTEAFANILSILDKHILSEDDDKKIIRIPIIFVIDEVDIYASSNRQTLLYNLFDLVENSSTPITTLCFSSKLTVKDLFEKRVRSRFSQRMIQFPKFPMGQFVSIAQKILSIDDPQNDYEQQWNEHVSKLISNDTALRKIVVHNHLTINNFKEFHNHCTYPLSKVSSSQPFINEKDFNKYASNHNKSSLKKIINSLSEIEISLLISAARLVNKNDLNWINLNTTYEEYLAQAKATNKIRSSTVFNVNSVSTGFKIWSKERCEEPWGVLQKLALLTPPNNQAKSGRSLDFSNNTVETKMWQLEITLDELRFIVDSDKNVKSWTRL